MTYQFESKYSKQMVLDVFTRKVARRLPHAKSITVDYGRDELIVYDANAPIKQFSLAHVYQQFDLAYVSKLAAPTSHS